MKTVTKKCKISSDKAFPDVAGQIQANFETQGLQKMWNYFLEIRKGRYYQGQIKALRKRYKIPKSGFSEGIHHPPKIWKFTGTKTHDRLIQDIKGICQRYYLHYADWSEVIESDLFYNQTDVAQFFGAYNVCKVVDLAAEKLDPPELDMIESDDAAYPIAIRISPYASLRDILDFVKGMSDTISDYQKPYKNKGSRLGKIKSRNTEIQKRDEFIYQNQAWASGKAGTWSLARDGTDRILQRA